MCRGHYIVFIAIPAPLPIVSGDPIQLTRVFQNLIGNAINYRSSTTPAICVKVEQRDLDWLFQVRDNGIGIAPEYTEKVFGIFKRLHGRAEHPGNGMGLAICRKILNRHGGRIWGESEVGKGSTFFFALPGDQAVRKSPN